MDLTDQGKYCRSNGFALGPPTNEGSGKKIRAEMALDWATKWMEFTTKAMTLARALVPLMGGIGMCKSHGHDQPDQPNSAIVAGQPSGDHSAHLRLAAGHRW